MENAAKALLIAAGMIIAVLIISALVLVYNQISTFYSQEHDRTVIEQKEKFNATYENYHGKTIRGNELISLMNRIIDYNNMQSSMQGYKKIVINVDMQGLADTLAYDGNANLINDPIRNTANDNDEAIKNLAELSINLAKKAEDNGISNITETKLQKLTEEIHNIDVDNPDENDKIIRAKKISSILGYNVDPNNSPFIILINQAIKEYYQLRNFKKAMFNCENVYYDQETARVNRMEFKVVVENDEIKLD